MKKDKSGDWITSIRIPREFVKIIEEQDLKIIEVFRRGMITYLYDLGLGFDNSLNKERSVFIKMVEKELLEFHENKIKELKGGVDDDIRNKEKKD